MIQYNILKVKRRIYFASRLQVNTVRNRQIDVTIDDKYDYSKVQMNSEVERE